MKRSPALLMLLVAACSSPTKPPTSTNGGTAPPPGGGGGGGDDAGTGTTPPPSSCSFAASKTFTLPTLAGAPTPTFPLIANSASCPAGTGKLTYALYDMNGDGLPDLYVTSACDDATVGTKHWLAYPNTGSGFGTTPIDFVLPTAPPTAGCVTASLFDINGDSLPDYVETARCDDPTVGTSRWLVYLNIKTGFAQTSVPYALPPGFSAGAFAATSAATPSCAGANDIPAFVLFDIDGDPFIDFVMTKSCTDTSIGTTAWQVFLGSESGAAQTATSFPLPTAPTESAGSFVSTSGTYSCTTTSTHPAYELVDFDVDGKLDILVTQECVDPTVGTSAWHWYRNSGKAFAASPATIALPAITGAPSGSFTSLVGAGQCTGATGAPTYTLADVQGDTVLDLLVTRDCGDPLTGVSYWEDFANVAGAGFTSARRRLLLPSALGATSTTPAGLTGALDCTLPRPAFATAFLADFTLGIVETASCANSTVGTTQWLLFSASCP